jgi:hypothetical protein
MRHNMLEDGYLSSPLATQIDQANITDRDEIERFSKLVIKIDKIKERIQYFEENKKEWE